MEFLKKLFNCLKDIFSLHCPDCGGRMNGIFYDMTIDKMV